MVYVPSVKAEEIFWQRLVLNHEDGERIAIFEIVVWKVATNKDYPNGVKYRAWISEGGKLSLVSTITSQKGHIFTLARLRSSTYFEGSMHFEKTSRR